MIVAYNDDIYRVGIMRVKRVLGIVVEVLGFVVGGAVLIRFGLPHFVASWSWGYNGKWLLVGFLVASVICSLGVWLRRSEPRKVVKENTGQSKKR
jgi:membrane protein implicated in regulation of membrane protease activity